MLKVLTILIFGLASAEEKNYEIISCNDSNKESLHKTIISEIKGLNNHGSWTKGVKFTNCEPFRGLSKITCYSQFPLNGLLDFKRNLSYHSKSRSHILRASTPWLKREICMKKSMGGIIGQLLLLIWTLNSWRTRTVSIRDAKIFLCCYWLLYIHKPWSMEANICFKLGGIQWKKVIISGNFRT